MKRVAPSRRERAERAAESSGDSDQGADRTAEALHRRARPVGRQLEHRRRPGEALAPVRPALRPAPLRRASSAARRQSPRTAPAARQAATADPRENAVVERRHLPHQHAQRPAVADDVVHARAAARAPSRPEPPERRAEQRPARQIERPAAPPPRPGPAAAGSAAPRARPDRSTSGTRKPGRSAGSPARRRLPSAHGNTVRSASCRRTTSPSTRASTATDSSPATRRAIGTL